MICPVCHSERNIITIGECNDHAEGRNGVNSDETTYYTCTRCMGFITHRVKIVDGRIINILLEYDIKSPLKSNTYA